MTEPGPALSLALAPRGVERLLFPDSAVIVGATPRMPELIGTAMAEEWGRVPGYAQSLEGILGEGALPTLLAEIQAHEREMTAVARRLFAGWLEHVVGVPSDRDLIHG